VLSSQIRESSYHEFEPCDSRRDLGKRQQPCGVSTETLKIEPEQIARIEFAEFCAALVKLPSEQRHSYAAAATSCGCAAGTIESPGAPRVRDWLTCSASVAPTDFGPDPVTRAVTSKRTD
jgi:RNA polymerase sigma-70 factor, ECF subfamily